MAEPIVINPSEFTPDAPSATPTRKAIKIDPAQFVPDSKYPKVLNPGDAGESVVKGIEKMIVPHDETQAWLTILGAGLPFVGKAAPLLEKLGAPLGEGAEYLAQHGIGPAAARTALQTGIGALTGGKSGAIEGAEVGGLGEAIPPIASRVSGLNTAEKAATGAMTESAADQVAQKSIENHLGVTADRAKRLAQPGVPGEGAQELANTTKAIGDVRHGAIREVGEKYEPIYGPIQNKPVAPDPLAKVSQAAKDATEWAVARGAKLAPATQKSLAELQSLSPTNIEANAVGGGKFRLTNEQIAALMNEEGGSNLEGVGAQTIGKLRGKLGQMMALANSPTTSAIDRRVLMDVSQPIVETLNDAVPEEQKPLLSQINNEYASINKIFPFKDLKKLNQAGTLPQLGDAFFGKGNEPATSMVLKRATPEQKDLMRKAFGAWILRKSNSPTQTLSNLAANKDIVADLFQGSPFEKIGAWREAMIAQRKFAQGPPDLPSQKAFARGVQEEIKKNGFSQEAAGAADKALAGTGALAHGGLRGFGRYLLVTGPMMGMMGWGPYHHVPEMLPAAAAYGAGILGWKTLADNPEALTLYRKFITNGWTRAGGEAFGRLLISAGNDAIRQGPEPQRQAPAAIEAGDAAKTLDRARAESIAPTPDGADRAQEVSKKLARGDKPPDVHADLNRGRLSLDELKKVLGHANKTDAGALLDNVPLEEAMSAVEVGSPEEKRMLIPILQQKLRAEMANQKGNRTAQAKLAMRMKRLMDGAGDNG